MVKRFGWKLKTAKDAFIKGVSFFLKFSKNLLTNPVKYVIMGMVEEGLSPNESGKIF